MHKKVYLICNIGLAGGKITYCQSACMVVYQPTQEKERRREKLVRQTNPDTTQSSPEYATKIFYQLPRWNHEFSECKALAICFSSYISAPCYAPISGVFSGIRHHI